METRRTFLTTATAGLLAGGCKLLGTDETYAGWKPGEFDIHFIHTGVGEQTFFIYPDGTTLLLDCGDTHHWKYMRDVPAQPSDRKMGGEWVSRYIQRLIPQRAIDYLLVSHWHGDHIGDPGLGGKLLPDGRVVAGITAVAEDFRFLRYSDHQYPRAGMYARDPDPKAFAMMQEWIPRAQKGGMQVTPFDVGRLDQFAPVHDRGACPGFHTRNICANAVLWDGANGTIDCGAEHIAGGGARKIHENRLSSALVFSYGKFRYFTGGDVELQLTGKDGRTYDWEARVGRAAGAVNVCKTNHHAGHHGGMNAGFCAAVQARFYLSSVWQPWMVHPESLGHMTDRRSYAGPRQVCYGYVAPITAEAIAPYRGDIAPAAGHVVVKVAPGGATYEVQILTAADESMCVLWKSGPIAS